MPVAPSRVDIDPSTADARGDAVLDGVFDKRLQDHVRHTRVERLGSYVHGDSQAIVKTYLLYLEIFSQELELLLQGDLLNFEILERHAEQIAEIGQHPIRRLAVFVDQLLDRMQRMEKEVRMKLHLQDLQS